MRLQNIIAAYRSSLVVPALDSGKAETGSSGATVSYNIADYADGIAYNSLHASQMSGIGYGRRSYAQGGLNWGGFVEPDHLDDALQLRWQDVVKFDIIAGTDAFGYIGMITHFSNHYPDAHGIGWMTDSDGYWRSIVLDTVRFIEPIRTMRSVQHVSLIADETHALSIVADAKTKTIYWIADGEIVDWYTPVEGIGPFNGNSRGLEYRVYVEDAEAKLRFHGGGDAYCLALGQAEAADVVGSVTQPTITIDDYGSDWVQLSGSAFIHSEGESHLATQWQITLDADTGFTSPVVDSGWVCRDLLLYITAGTLEPETDYRARVRYIAEDGVKSDWSDPGTFTTTAEPTEPDTPWSNTGALCEPGEVEPVTPWDKPSC